eukprot:186082_1
MSRLLLILLAFIYVVSSTPSHSPPSGNYRTPAVCGDCMSELYGCWAVDDGDYASCNGDNLYATCSTDVDGVTHYLTNDRPCAANLVWDDNVGRCEAVSSCGADPIDRTPDACSSCIDADFGCDGVYDGDYPSCDGPDYYVSCGDGVLYDERPCPGDLVWDDNNKQCDYSSSCP